MSSKDAMNNEQDSVAVKPGTATTSVSPVINFNISLHSVDEDDDHEHQYEPGHQLTGDVVLVLASALRVSSIVVELRGEASVAFKADEHCAARSTVSVSARRPLRQSCSRWHQASELYVDEHQEILLTDNDDDLLQPGEHRFPMSFQLSPGLPTSFCGKFGSVSYVLRASFVDQSSTSTSSRRLAAARYVVCEPFLVRRAASRAAVVAGEVQPVSVKLSRRLFAAAPFICASGLLRVDFTVADGAKYQLGDDIRVTVRVSNDSPRVVVGVVVSLVQLCEFRAQTARRRCAALVSRRCDTEGRLTPAGYADTERSTNFRLSVPPDLPESHLDSCDVIDVDYELRFTVEVTGCRRRLKKRLPVLITGRQASHRLVSRLPLNGPASSTINDIIDRSRALSLSDEIISRFRRPMAPGDTRQNIAFDIMLDQENLKEIS